MVVFGAVVLLYLPLLIVIVVGGGLEIPLLSGTNKNRDVSTGPLARPLARSLAPLTRRKVNDWMAILSVFSIFDHSELV